MEPKYEKLLSRFAFNVNLRRYSMVLTGRDMTNQAHIMRSLEYQDLGRAVQVDPIKPKLKAPGTKRLTPKYDERLSNFAFKFKLRRYTRRSVPPSSPTPW